MNKKGFTLSMEVISDLVMFAFVLLLFLGAIEKIKNDDLHIQEKEVREVALTKDAALASPEKIDLEYLVQNGFKVEVDENCKVKVEKVDQSLAPSPSEFYCGFSKDERVSPLKKVNNFVEVKTG